MPTPPHKCLRPADLARLRPLVFSTRRPAHGRYAGRHASPRRGQSVEFTDYRAYLPGDDPAAIDWKAYARSDRLIVKRFEHQTDMSVHLLLDTSASMGYSGVGGVESSKLKVEREEGKSRRAPSSPFNFQPSTFNSKYDHAARLAAAIGFLVIKQQDRVSLTIARDGLRHVHRPMGSMPHLMGMLTAMERVEPSGEADLAGALRELSQSGSRTGGGDVLVLISDLLDDPAPILRALSTFRGRGRGGEVIIFHVLHPDELNLPPVHDALLTDSETGAQLTANLDDVRPVYEKRMREFLDGWAAACKTRGIDYNLVSTATDYTTALERYLLHRAER